MKKSNIKAKSDCCRAAIRICNGMSDFIGEKNPSIGTMYYECSKCGKPCNVYIPIRKTFKINPKTRVQPNKKKEHKITKKEINSWID